jgi:glycosyltransferase involved in cell wall biosynthesis
LKVSIIIPLHNAEAFIEAAIASCLNQTYTTLEVIVVENSSKDDSWKLVRRIQDPRLKCFQISKANAAAARNYGFKQADGDFIMFLDADDVLAPNKIEIQLASLTHKPNDWLASCAWAKFTHDIKEAKIEPQSVWPEEDPLVWCIKSFIGHGMMIPGCWLIPKFLIEKAGLWDERLSLHDDGEFMCRVLLASKGQVFVEDTYVYYRQVEGSLSRNNQSLKAAKSALAVCQSYHKQLLQRQDNEQVRKALAYNYCRLLYEFYPKHKSVLKEASEQLKKLDVKPLPLVGSNQFKNLVKWVGFDNALRVTALKRLIN